MTVQTTMPDGMVCCPACDGSGEIEHWTVCLICDEYKSKDPRYELDVEFHTYCPLDVALAYAREQAMHWVGKVKDLESEQL